VSITVKNTTISLLLLAAILLSSWSILTSSSMPINPTTENPNEADAFMQDVVTTALNKEGKPAFQLATPKMTHYPAGDTTHIVTPHVTFYKQSSKPWYIDADYANATHGTHEVVFSNHVNIHHPADEDHPNTKMQTDTLTIFPDQQVASTNDPVIFMQPDTTIHAIGMLANLTAGTIKLLSKAKGEYAPQS
jgi:lipopolysaccharide export system protein LptC